MIRITKIILPLFLLILVSSCSKQHKSTEQNINIYLVAANGTTAEGKKFGCNDILVPVTKIIKPEEQEIEAALNELLTFKDTDELINFVKGPQLLLFQVNVAGGIADVYLKGDFQINGVCDIPRIKEQIQETVNQFKEFKKVNLYLNNQTLDSYLNIARKGFR